MKLADEQYVNAEGNLLKLLQDAHLAIRTLRESADVIDEDDWAGHVMTKIENSMAILDPEWLKIPS